MYLYTCMYMDISSFPPACAWQRKPSPSHPCLANGEAAAWSVVMHAGTCLDTGLPCLLWCLGRLVVLIILLASKLRVHWYFKKLLFHSLTIRIFYKSLHSMLLQAQWHSFFMFWSIGQINSHHQTGCFCQGLTHRVIWMLQSQQGTGILIY